MIIYDKDNKRCLSGVTLFLTPSEAAELGSSAASLSAHPDRHHHHVNSADYLAEIVVAVYTDENLGEFDMDSQKLIKAAKIK